VVVLSELAHPKDAGLVAQKIIDELKRPFQLNGNEVFIGISVGIAAFPGDGEDGDTLLKNADAAMYGAKNAGKGTYRYYTAALNAPVLEKMVLESNLQRALERDEFVLHFQPKAALMDGTLTGCEVLLRWQSPDKGLIYPGEFVPVLEGSGLIVRAGEWVVRSACRQMKAWHEAGLAPLPIAVNLSAKQFEHQDICAMVEQALHDFDIQPSLLTLEVTESAAMHNPDEAIVTLGRLKALGVRLSIDDFGTGYSSLSYLKRFPVDYLKLDRSFVAGLPGDVDDAAIALAVITMAHSLGLKVVAEGVETEAQIAFLEANGCDEMQGFLLARPMAAAEYAQWLARVRRLCEPKIASGDPLRVNRPWR
jgi:EAL domain-containing protein (putative c-di-GMP-specific phosphodiesterase class I)